MNLAGISGIGTEGVIAIVLFLLVKDLLIPLYRRTHKKNGKFQTAHNNPNSKPGNAQACKENRDKITKLETTVENLEKKVNLHCQQNREDHQKIFDKLDKLRSGGN